MTMIMKNKKYKAIQIQDLMDLVELKLFHNWG